MTLAALPLGAVLHGSGEPMRHVYFPVSGLVSLFYTLRDGNKAELAVGGGWLLLTMDRIASTEVHMTQELLSDILGVRRGSITRAAANMRDAGLISHGRGLFTVANRDKPQAHGCECYGVLKKETDRLLRRVPA